MAQQPEFKTLGFIGLGNMGAALAQGVCAGEKTSDLRLVGYDPSSDAGTELPVTRLNSAAEVFRESDAVIVAVKPQYIEAVVSEACQQYAVQLLVSVAAGVSIETLRAATGGLSGTSGAATIIRTMPNIGATVGAAATALYTDSEDAASMQFARTVFSSVGEVVELSSEEQMHGFTGAVGSGIAYGFVFAEALADAAVAEGLSRADGKLAAAAVLRGAAEMLLANPDKSPAALKDAVCSPAGTTIEGVAALERGGFRSAVIGAVRAASSRSRALARGARS